MNIEYGSLSSSSINLITCIFDMDESHIGWCGVFLVDRRAFFHMGHSEEDTISTNDAPYRSLARFYTIYTIQRCYLMALSWCMPTNQHTCLKRKPILTGLFSTKNASAVVYTNMNSNYNRKSFWRGWVSNNAPELFRDMPRRFPMDSEGSKGLGDKPRSASSPNS